MIEELQKGLYSMLKSLDVFYVLKNLKPASRILVEDEYLTERRDFLESFGLKTAVSNFKILAEKEQDKEFTNKGYRIDAKSNKKGKFFLYVSKSIEIAKKAKQSEEKNEHKKVGLCLGYPKCCSDSFAEHFTIESKRYNDYILAALKASKGFQFLHENNFAARNFDLALISHFPCSFNCDNSIKIAQNNLAEIKKDNREVAYILDEMLKGSVIYTEEDGIFFLRKSELKDNKLSYSMVMASVNNRLFHDIKEAEYIEVIDKDTIRINNKILDGRYGFLNFT